jgi:hypothetical protein
MKRIRPALFFMLILLSAFQCSSEEKVVVPDEDPTGCDLSGAWNITVTENCTKLTGKYSGSDCAGILKADFVSESFSPDAGS